MQIFKPLIILSILTSVLFAKPKQNWVPDSFKADFTKLTKDFFTKKVTKHKGQLFYQYPKRLRMEVEGKTKTVHVTNPHDYYYYRGPSIKNTPGELTISKPQGAGLSQLFDALRSNGLKSNKDYKVLTKGLVTEVSFSKKMSEKLKILSAKLTFKSQDRAFRHISKIDVTLDNDSELNFELLKVVSKVKFKKEFFVFKAPEKTNIFRQN